MKLIRCSNCRVIFIFIFLNFSFQISFAQSDSDFLPRTNTDTNEFKIIKAGEQYNKSKFHQWLWGRHYRDEWNTAVKVKYLDLDSAGGGLTPSRLGGGRQTTTLHLNGEDGKQYVFRSIDKTYTRAMPEEFHGTWVENLANDQVSTAHPYAAITIPPMISAAGLYHTKPEIVLIPNHERLGEYRNQFAGMLVLFEERADEDQSDASHFGNTENAVGTAKMKEKVFGDHNNRVDQSWYTKTRLFDMFIGDWGRHDDQWRWATIDKGENKIYRPIPRDRDQVYTLFDGKLMGFAVSATGQPIESFDSKVKNIADYNFPARYLDRQFANELTKNEWLEISGELQQLLTDSVIETGIKQLPPEVYPISGEEIIKKLKSRRDGLSQMAADYYDFLSKEVEITGSDKKEYFHINILNDKEVAVKIHKIKIDEIDPEPFYSRTFNSSETKEIRLYGLAGDDVFFAEGEKNNSITIRIIGGEGKDSVRSVTAKNIHVYDNEQVGINPGASLKTHIADDTLRNNYRYDAYQYDKKGIKFKGGTTVGIGYSFKNYTWGKHPFGSEHSIMLEYMLNRNGLGLVYRGLVNQLIGKNNLALLARIDFPFVDNFFGVGNESFDNLSNRYNRIRTNEFIVGIGLNRFIDSHFVQVQPFYQTIQVRYDEDRIISKPDLGITLQDRERKHYGGIEAQYRYQKKDDPIVTTKGFGFFASASHAQNINETKRSFNRFTSSFAVYLPIFKTLSLASRIGGATITGEPEFYQWNTLGGATNLRGFVRRRFFGRTSFYNNNELRWMVPAKNKIFTGKIGLLGFVDQGRLWHPGEDSDKWHVGYGGGLIIAPFKKALLNGTVGLSENRTVLHLRIGYLF